MHRWFTWAQDSVCRARLPSSGTTSLGKAEEDHHAVNMIALQLGWPDMRLPILYTMSWPERVPCSEGTWPRLDFRKCSELTFKEPDHAKYPSMELAYSAGRHVTLLRNQSLSGVSPSFPIHSSWHQEMLPASSCVLSKCSQQLQRGCRGCPNTGMGAPCQQPGL